MCQIYGLSILPTNQGAVQADVKTPLFVIGETKGIEITGGAHVFRLDASVVREDIGDINAGEPFLEINDITVRPAKKRIIKGRDIVNYASTSFGHPTIRRIQTFLCRAPSHPTTTFPGEYVTIKTISDFEDSTVAIEPRTDSKTYIYRIKLAFGSTYKSGWKCA